MMQVYTFHSTKSASFMSLLHPYHAEVRTALAHYQLKQNSLRVLEISTNHKMNNKTNIINAQKTIPEKQVVTFKSLTHLRPHSAMFMFFKPF
jgi:hypothetical protein